MDQDELELRLKAWAEAERLAADAAKQLEATRSELTSAELIQAAQRVSTLQREADEMLSKLLPQ